MSNPDTSGPDEAAGGAQGTGPLSPVAAKIVLGARLRRLRETAAVTPQRAARVIRGSDSKISRIELGRHAARETDVIDLLNCYQVTDQAERDDLLALASRALTVPWWQRFADLLPPWFSTYLGLEESADSIISYDTHFFPGLLQTAEYAAWLALLRDFRPPAHWPRDSDPGDSDPGDLTDPDTLSRFGELQAQRLARFAAGRANSGQEICCVVDQAVLLRSARDPGMRRAQLGYVLQAASEHRISVRIRLLTAGPPITPVGFSLLRFAEPLLPDVVYTESLTSATYLDRPADVTRYASKLDRLLRTSAPAEQTPEIIGQLLRRQAS